MGEIMALTCSDCGARIELPPEERRRLAGKFFACPDCGTSRRLPPVKDEEPVIVKSKTPKTPIPTISDNDNEDAPHNEVLLKKVLLAIFGIVTCLIVFFLLSVQMVLVWDAIRGLSTTPLVAAVFGFVVMLGAASFPGIYAYRIWRSLSGDYGMTFRHPSNNFAVKLDDPFVMSLPFGPFYYAYHEAWMMFIITGVLVLGGLGVPWLVLPWFTPHLMRRLYMKQGYRQTYGPET